MLRHLGDPFRLMTALLFGSGLRLGECCRLRIQDVDLEQRQIRVRDGKGRKDRVTLLPERLVGPLRAHLEGVKRQHETDYLAGGGAVPIASAQVPDHGRRSGATFTRASCSGSSPSPSAPPA